VKVAHTRTPAVEVRHSLLEAAARLLQREGTDALSVRHIAAEAGVAPMCVYNRFGGKNGIVDELFIDGFDELAMRMRGIAVSDARDGLVASAECYWAFAQERPQMYAVMFDRAVSGYTPSDEARQHAADCFGTLVALVGRGIDAGVLAPADPIDVAHQLWASMHGLVSLTLRGLGFIDDVDGFRHRLVDTLLRGLSPAAS
jgi:AcrR family transcriptional regulator